MDIEKKKTAGKIKDFSRVLKKAGIRVTHQRLIIYKEVLNAVDHPDVESIYRRVKEELPTVSLDTIYRTLWLLIDLKLITTLGPAREKMRFDGNVVTHHHFICTECGYTRDFCDENLDKLSIPKEVNKHGRVDKTLVEVHGTCNNCNRT